MRKYRIRETRDVKVKGGTSLVVTPRDIWWFDEEAKVLHCMFGEIDIKNGEEPDPEIFEEVN
jgi:hypothetical protein